MKSDPFCVICEFNLTGMMICFNDERCDVHQTELEEMIRSEGIKNWFD